MRTLLISAGMGIACGLVSCGEEESEVVVTETREITTGDRAPKLMATSQERFRRTQAAAADYAFELPDGWTEVPKTQMRLLNFTAGPDGQVEIYLSRTRGDLASNIGRWYRQFDAEMPTAEEVGALPRVPILGAEGLLVEASGTYAPGMGRPEAEGYGLAGVIATAGDGVLTVKMVGPEQEVAAQVEALKAFAGSLRLGE